MQIRQLASDVRDDEEQELRRLEGGMVAADGADSGGGRGAGGKKRGGGSMIRGSNSKKRDSGDTLMLPAEEDVRDVLRYYERKTARLEKRQRKSGPQRTRAYGLEHMVTMAFTALNDANGSRAAQVIAEMRRQFPQLSAQLFAEDWEAQACRRAPPLPHAVSCSSQVATSPLGARAQAGEANTQLTQGLVCEAGGEEGGPGQRRGAEAREEEGRVSPQTANSARRWQQWIRDLKIG